MRLPDLFDLKKLTPRDELFCPIVDIAERRQDERPFVWRVFVQSIDSREDPAENAFTEVESLAVADIVEKISLAFLGVLANAVLTSLLIS